MGSGIKGDASVVDASPEVASNGPLLTLTSAKKKFLTNEHPVTMYNWSLLLLAFFAVFQPIASFIERNLVDGREQCCGHRLSRDTPYSLYGDSPFKLKSRRINDQHRDIREVRRDERRNENFPASLRALDTFRDSYREREIRKSPELRTRYSRTDLRRERESRVEVRNDFETPEQRKRNFPVLSSFTGRIRSTENRRDSRVIRTDDSRIFRTRNENNQLDRHSLERLMIDSRRETRSLRDNVDEVRRTRDIRNTRKELRRTRDKTIQRDTLRALNNQRIQRDVPLERQDAATRLVLRNQRSVRSQDISRQSNDDRRLSFESFRIAKQERANHDARARARDEVRNEAVRRNIEIVTQRSDIDREIGSRLSKIHIVRSLDRLSRESNDRKLFFENVKISQQERVNRDMRAQERDYVRSIEKPVRERSEVDREISSRFLTPQQTVLRNQRSIRSLDRFSMKRSDDNRISSENYRIGRDDVRNEAEQRNIVKLIRERSELAREISARFSETRQAVLGNQRSVRSLDRLSRSSNDGRLSFENIRIAQREHENRDVRVRERDDVRIEAERRNVEKLVRERSEVDREIGSRFLATRQADLRNQRNVRALDRISMRSNDRKGENRDVKARDNIRIKAERRNIENRVRSEVDREIGSRFSLARQADNNRERRLSIDSMRRNNELRISTILGDRANQINRDRKNEYGYRSDRRVSRKRNFYDRRSFDPQFAALSRMDVARTQVDKRITNQMRIQEESRNNDRDDIRGVSLKNRRTREMTQWRLSRSESRLFDNRRAHRSLNVRERQINEYTRIVDDRTHGRMQNQGVQLRDISRTVERENVLLPQNKNHDERQQRVENRVSRGKAVERRSIRERINSEQWEAREGHQRVAEIKNSRFRDSESRFRTTSESRIIERKISRTRDNVRNVERKNTRDVDERRDSTSNVIVSKTTERHNIDIRAKANGDFAIDHRNETSYKNNWQNLIYTMQGIYLCSIFIPMLMSSTDKKKAKTLGLWTPFQKLIKTD